MVALSGCDSHSDNYENCILNSMNGVNSDLAAKAIIASCRSKYQSSRPEEKQIPPSELKMINGKGGEVNGHKFFGQIFNGSKVWTVTQITIRLTPAPSNEKSKMFSDEYLSQFVDSADSSGRSNFTKQDGSNLPSVLDYNVEVNIPPLSMGDFRTTIDRTSSAYSWTIVGASGFEKSR